MIPELIDKQDNFEIIRDKIAMILVSEVASQMAYATAGGKDPNEWKLRIFTERSNPWEQFLNDNVDRSPLVNVWVDNCNYDPKGSNSIERQKTIGTYNIDCYGFGISSDVETGHKPGDREAAFAVQHAIRLVRNIIMAGEYTYLGLRGLVWSRWFEGIEIFQPQQDSKEIQKIVGARATLTVVFNEFSPQVVPINLEMVTIDIKRTENGEIILEADYDYT